MFCMNTTSCSCGCGGCGCSGGCKGCGFNQCAVTCGNSVQGFGDYAYIYNTTAQTVAADAPFTFSANGPLSGSITHTAGTENIVIGKTGMYLISFFVDSSAETDQITLYKNSEPVTGGAYPTTNGQVIVAAQTGDVITLENTGAAEIALTANDGEVNASMTIVRIF